MGRPVRRVSHNARGLSAPVDIVLDHWGVPHIYAQSEDDVFFAQGYNVARDRLWQIDLWRKRGLGLLARSFGAAYVDQDRAARLFLYRGDMAREWACYAPGAKAVTESFVSGVNAYVEATLAGERPMPPEFALTKSKPDFWHADDVVRIRNNVVSSNAVSEAPRAMIAALAGLHADRWRWPLEPPHDRVVPDGLDVSRISPDVLKVYGLAHGPVVFPNPAGNAVTDAGGSNCWVIAPNRTDTGRPILANDPHRMTSVPALRYVVHLEAPGVSLLGAGEPGLPGISLGHNGRIAWGITVFNMDQEDLYVYALKPEDFSAYAYDGGIEAFHEIREVVEVAGAEPVEVTLQFTRHGPVLHRDHEKGVVVALRMVRSEPGAAGYFASSWLWKASSWADFLIARDRWVAPALNLCFADVAGNVGWAVAGAAPIRPNWDGLMPVPGDGRYEWSGLREGSELPSLLNPPSGWFASANEMNLTPDYLALKTNLSFEWPNRARYERIAEVLAANNAVSISDSAALQVDTRNVIHRRVSALLQTVISDDAAVADALQLLRSWDGDEHCQSAAAALFQVWTGRHLTKAVVVRVAPAAAAPLIGPGSLDVTLTCLEPGGELAGSAGAEAILQSLAAAVSELRSRLGADPAQWSWGALHQAEFTPDVAKLAPHALQRQMSTGRLQIGGSGDTPAAAAYGEDFTVYLAGALRLVIDVGAWDNSCFISAPGQSGDPFDSHYRDHFAPWAQGRFAPLLYSREAVMANAETIITLSPA